VYRRRRLVAGGILGLAVLLIAVLIATAGGSDEDAADTPADLGVPTTSADRAEEADRDRPKTNRTETEASQATPVAPQTGGGTTGGTTGGGTTGGTAGGTAAPVAPSAPAAPAPAPAPAPQPTPQQGAGGGTGQAPQAAPTPRGGEGGGVVAPPSDRD
jgi:hypothetical protein